MLCVSNEDNALQGLWIKGVQRWWNIWSILSLLLLQLSGLCTRQYSSAEFE